LAFENERTLEVKASKELTKMKLEGKVKLKKNENIYF